MERNNGFTHSRFVSRVLAGILALGVIHGEEALRKVSKKEGNSAVISRVSPEYPPVAKQLHMIGSVELEAIVSESGAVEKVNIVSGNPVLTRAAAEALRKWTYTPFTSDGKVVRAVVPVSLSIGM
jgi:protein TonB